MATNREKVLEYAQDKQFVGLPQECAAVGQVIEPHCGDVLKIGFNTRREIITEIGYDLTESACPPVHACAHLICQLAKDKAVIQGYLITYKQIAEMISDNGELDPEHVHCAQMAELALKQAVSQYSLKKKSEL